MNDERQEEHSGTRPEEGRPESESRPEDKPAGKKLDPEHQDIEDNKVFAALSYLGPLLIVPLLMSRDSDYIRFHARRGLVLFFAEVLLSFLFWNPLFMMLLGLAFIVISLYGFVQAVLGHHWKPKVLSDIADRIRL